MLVIIQFWFSCLPFCTYVSLSYVMLFVRICWCRLLSLLRLCSLLLFSIVTIGLQQFSWTTDISVRIVLMQWFPLAFCMIVFRHTVGLLWTGDQPVSETPTCTGQHNVETQGTNIYAVSGIRTAATKRPQTYASDRAATEVGILVLVRGISSYALLCWVISLWVVSWGCCIRLGSIYRST
jgi:hypothetical protein